MDSQVNLAESQILPAPTSKEFQGIKIAGGDSVWEAWADSDAAECGGEGVLVDPNTPIDANCRSGSRKLRLTAVLGLSSKHQKDSAEHTSGTRQGASVASERVAVLELFKIVDVEAFKYACRKYEEGLEQGRSNGELVDMIVKIQEKRG